MAITLPLPGVQGARYYLGPDLQADTKLVVPGTSDYTTGGYVITAVECGFKLIQSAVVVEQNAAATGWYALPVFAIAQLSTSNAGFSGYSQFLLKLLIVTTGVEPTANSNITGTWALEIKGY